MNLRQKQKASSRSARLKNQLAASSAEFMAGMDIGISSVDEYCYEYKGKSG